MENQWQEFLTSFSLTKEAIENVLRRVRDHVRNAHAEELQRLQILLSVPQSTPTTEANLPCSNLPASRSARFYNRDGIIQEIDDFFYRAGSETAFRSIALYGLGGVGKSHVALKFASRKLVTIPAVLWVKSETELALAQSFTDIAVRLQLRGADPRKHAENRVLLLTWLQTTCESPIVACRNLAI